MGAGIHGLWPRSSAAGAEALFLLIAFTARLSRALPRFKIDPVRNVQPSRNPYRIFFRPRMREGSPHKKDLDECPLPTLIGAPRPAHGCTRSQYAVHLCAILGIRCTERSRTV